MKMDTLFANNIMQVFDKSSTICLEVGPQRPLDSLRKHMEQDGDDLKNDALPISNKKL